MYIIFVSMSRVLSELLSVKTLTICVINTKLNDLRRTICLTKSKVSVGGILGFNFMEKFGVLAMLRDYGHHILQSLIRHSPRVLSATTEFPVSVVTHLCRHLIYNSRGASAWHAVKL